MCWREGGIQRWRDLCERDLGNEDTGIFCIVNLASSDVLGNQCFSRLIKAI